jgi:ParB family chromosome partitioning protein
MTPKPGLGRGLGALIPGANEIEASRAGVVEIAVTDIRANPRQPRLVRGQESLQLEELEIALVENIQRNDLSPLEEAAAFQQLINEFGLTPDAVAERVGKSRVAIYNTLRLLKLPGQIQAALMQGEISEGHARALLSLSSAVDQLAVLNEIKAHDLNVRQTEELIRRLNSPKTTEKKAQRDQRWQGAKEYESRLREALGTKVALVRSRKGGRIIIEFYSEEEFEAIYEKLIGSGR